MENLAATYSPQYVHDLNEENKKLREALEFYADKTAWLGEDRSGPVQSGKWHVHPITWVWRGFVGDTTEDHPCDIAIEALNQDFRTRESDV